MTSTPFNIGYNDGTRLSSRVLRPPGGGHTDIFGREPEPTRGRRPAPAAAAPIGVSVDNDIAEEQCQNGQATTPEVPEKQEISVPEPPPVEEPSFQPPVPSKTAVTNKDEGQKRVRVPPGGFSTPLW